MDQRPRTYTIEQLEQESGFDRRTIAYYVQEGLLPKIGRRGPRTRYPRLFLDRLLFIRRMRELQEEGRTGTMTLAEIRVLLEEMSEHELAEVAAGRVQPEESVSEKKPSGVMGMLARSIGVAEDRTASLAADRASLAIESPRRRAKRMVAREASPPPPVAAEPDQVYDGQLDSLLDGDERYSLAQPIAIGQGPPRPEEIGELLDELQCSVGSRRSGPDSTSEHWTRARVTPDITLSARDLDEDGVDLLERVARLLKRMMRRR
jgi:DNA-binding transcriptional MerR regulator